MKNTLTKEKTNSLYKNAFFVGIIAISLFNLSNANAQGMMRKGEVERPEGRMMAMEKGKKDVIGTVTAISGNTLTISQTFKGEGKTAATTTKIFTVDASTAKIIKNGATSSVSSIVIGDKLSVVGTISGTNITAKIIRNDIPGMMRNGGGMMGDGKPVVEGKITSVSGNTVVITNNSNVTYTVDTTNAKIFVNGSTSTISSLQVNSDIVVQGTVNGTNIAATSVMTHQNKNNESKAPEVNKGFFGKMKNFFGHMFGF